MFQPFELDYFQVLYTTCDMIVETYQKVLYCLGLPTPSTSIQPPTPGGFPTPPSSSYSGSDRQTPLSMTPGLNPALIDVVQKIDIRLKVSRDM